MLAALAARDVRAHFTDLLRFLGLAEQSLGHGHAMDWRFLRAVVVETL